MKNSSKKRWIIVVGIVVGIACLLFWLYIIQTNWLESEPYQRVSQEASKTVVVVYSCTGNTMSVAKEVARYFDADFIKIDAPQYSRDLKGQILASKHAAEEITTTPIIHDSVDINQYELIFLCSPTWWYRPAVPLWSFVENHDFGNKPVFLIMTGNSRMTEERTGKFATLVEEKNGIFLDVLFIRRGRIYWQKTPEEVNQEVLEALEERNELWYKYIKK